MMRLGSAIVALAALVAAGCSTIVAARRAQRAAEPAASGEQAAAGRVSLAGRGLAGLVDFALTNRPQIARARLAVEDERLALRALAADAPLASSTPWTALAASVGAGFGGSESSQDFHEAKRIHGGTASASLSLDLLIWDFGRYNARASAQRERVLAAELDLAAAGYTVFKEVVDTYFDLLERDALLVVACTNELEFAVHLEQAERALEAGEVQELDVLRARLDLSVAKEKTLSASNAVATAFAKLACALGLDASLVEREDVLPRMEDPLRFVMQGFAATTDGSDEVYAFARTNSPAMQVTRAKLRAASAAVDAAVADLMPEVSVSASLSWTDPMWALKWGVSAVQSLFQGLRRTTAVDRARVALEQAETDVAAAEHTLSRDLELAVAARDNAAEARLRAEDSLRQALENFAVVRSKFELGEANRVDFGDAVAALSSSVGGVVSAFYSGQVAEADLFRLAGVYPVYDEKAVVASDAINKLEEGK